MTSCARIAGIYDDIPTDTDDLIAAYRRHLVRRNGALTPDGFEIRKERIAAIEAGGEPYRGFVDADLVRRSWVRFIAADRMPKELVAMLLFLKLNAGEAHGVQLCLRARARLHERDEPFFKMEKQLGLEELWHTRLFAGVGRHFGVEIEEPWPLPWTLALLIQALCHAPPAMFHPICLGAEIHGLFTFNWVLNNIPPLFADHPALRDSMERRLIEVMTDEVGHIAFNRLAVGPAGLAAGKTLAALCLRFVATQVLELDALGFDAEARRGIDRFDLRDLPEQVRRDAFFA